jgi:hypothetical protein
MRAMLAGVLAAGACLTVVGSAEAQWIGAPVDSSTPIVTTFPPQGELLPYSYWISAPNPARVYVEYGSVDQFPFHGRPYGSPNDRWSWYNMGGGNSRYLARYYYPPLR